MSVVTGADLYQEYRKGRRDFRGLDLRDIDINHMYFDNADFSESDFTGAILDSAKLREVNFLGAKLDHISAVSCLFVRSCFVEASLCDSNFQWANFYEAILDGSRINKSVFPYADMKHTSFVCADLTDSGFSKALIISGDLRKSVLFSTNFYDCNLEHSIFKGARIYGNTIFSWNILRGVDFRGTDLTCL